MILAKRLFLLLFFFAAGCTPGPNDNGAGLDLFTKRTPVSTNNLAVYFQELCSQTQLVPSGTSGNCSDYSTLVRAGFNDIDLRCDRYLAWIDNKRIEASRFRSSVTATNTALTGILTISNPGTDSIAYVGQVLGFATSIYDAYNNNLLLGLETSTIKRIVYERRLEFRKQFSGIHYANTPDMVFALRSYLRICTPQTIVLDANTYALSAAAGITPEALSVSVGREADAIRAGRAPVTARSPVNVAPKRSPVPSCPECDKLFPKSGFTESEIKAAQRGLCIDDDAKVGKGTLAAVQSYRATQGITRTGLVTESEFSDITSQGCQPGERSAGVRNFYEASSFHRNPANLTRLVQNLNTILPDDPLADADASLGSNRLRQRIAEVRSRLGQSTGNAERDIRLSRNLKNSIDAEARRIRSGG